MIENIWNLFGNDLFNIITTILSLSATYIATKIKKLYEEKVNTETKKSVVKTVVNAIEKIYKDLNGREKLEKAKQNVIFLLKEKGISITELELNMLIEEVCNSFEIKCYE